MGEAEQADAAPTPRLRQHRAKIDLSPNEPGPEQPHVIIRPGASDEPRHDQRSDPSQPQRQQRDRPSLAVPCDDDGERNALPHRLAPGEREGESLVGAGAWGQFTPKGVGAFEIAVDI
jgi:hypothetical protein